MKKRFLLAGLAAAALAGAVWSAATPAREAGVETTHEPEPISVQAADAALWAAADSSGEKVQILYYDWDNTLIGAQYVPAGDDARAAVNSYVKTHLIHPDLWTAPVSSLTRRDTYRGKYSNPSADPGGCCLTGYLDYVFLKRPLLETDVRVWEQPQEADGTAIWDETYPYIHGWAVVPDVSHPEYVGTVLGIGELAAYSGADEGGGYRDQWGAPARLEVAEAGYNETPVRLSAIQPSCFQIANFNFAQEPPVLTKGVYAVKACYEPGKRLTAGKYLLSCEPSTSRLSHAASRGNATYEIILHYTNITASKAGDAYGVPFIRQPKLVNRMIFQGTKSSEQTDDDGTYEADGISRPFDGDYRSVALGTPVFPLEYNSEGRAFAQTCYLGNVDYLEAGSSLIIALTLPGMEASPDFVLVDTYNANPFYGRVRSERNRDFCDDEGKGILTQRTFERDLSTTASIPTYYQTPWRLEVSHTQSEYTVEHWYWDLDEDRYVLKELLYQKGNIGETVTASPISIPGYVENTASLERIPAGVVAEDGSTLLRLYYNPSETPVPPGPTPTPTPTPSPTPPASKVETVTVTRLGMLTLRLTPANMGAVEEVKPSRRGTRQYSISPSAFHTVKNVVVDGKDLGAVMRFTVPADGKDHTATVTFNCPSLAFEDVAASAWYHDAVDYMISQNYMVGTGRHLSYDILGKREKKPAFEPELGTSRAMMAQIMYRVAGSPTKATVCRYTDVPKSAWYAAAVSWAEDTGVVEGYGDGRFGPDDLITREQFVTMLWRHAGKPKVAALARRDLTGVSPWAVSAVSWAVREGLLQGDETGNLLPTEILSRAQAAALVERYTQLKT